MANAEMVAAGAGDDLLDVRGVAGLLGCSAKHVRRLTDRGAMPAPLRLGRLVRFHRRSIVEWIGRGCPSCRPAGRKGGR